MKNKDKKCKKCNLPVYAKGLCRRHYKSLNDKKNNTAKKRWQKIKGDPLLLELKRDSDTKYRLKKKLGIETKRKTKDNSLINNDWQKYAKLWTIKTNYLSRKSRKTQKCYHKTRLRVLSHYSKGIPFCNNCGVKDERVLSIDHINDDGYKHRKEINQSSIVFWIVKNNFPKGFQVLCHNCNWLKELESRKNKFDTRNKKEYKPLTNIKT